MSSYRKQRCKVVRNRREKGVNIGPALVFADAKTGALLGTSPLDGCDVAPRKDNKVGFEVSRGGKKTDALRASTVVDRDAWVKVLGDELNAWAASLHALPPRELKRRRSSIAAAQAREEARAAAEEFEAAQAAEKEAEDKAARAKEIADAEAERAAEFKESEDPRPKLHRAATVGPGSHPAYRTPETGAFGGPPVEGEYEVVISHPGPMGFKIVLDRSPGGGSAIVVDTVNPGGQADRAGMLRRSRLVAVAGASVKTGRRASTIDVYGILGIDKDADDAAIRRAYKKTSLKAHPDRGGRTSIFQKVKKAHDVLSDEQARRDYDAQADSVDFEKALHLLKNAARPLAISLIRPVGL